LYCTLYEDATDVKGKLIVRARDMISQIDTQEKKLLGFVQSTQSGKTRLMIEISLTTPLILISFKRENMAYQELESIVDVEKRKLSTDFNEFQARARRIFFLVKVFYLAYLRFFGHYFYDNNKTWEASSQDERKIFSWLLLNGGGEAICILFKMYKTNLVDSVDFKSAEVKKMIF
jgi:hypothetical protein